MSRVCKDRRGVTRKVKTAQNRLARERSVEAARVTEQLLEKFGGLKNFKPIEELRETYAQYQQLQQEG